ncbi:DUF3344 domain-containing protein [Methanogenium sp. S4BF]|uniref:DUF3344 domain-containing protein n=1 Tax=Methanogenium sp. S4BF TaxID=1789226 RepID=UPI002416ADAD|nr:DUF3344 domain-containing protein [Methanogenium sp. S4BF]WFN34321.1 DUF3344 domain-containing protein [Methanogenium sp. S4BF]
MKKYPVSESDRITPRAGAILAIAILLLIFLVPPAMADNYVGGMPLDDAKEGTVSGGIWMDSFYGMSGSSPLTLEQRYRLPEYTAIRWARLYVSVYCGNMESNYAGTATVEFDGGSGYSQMGMESLNVPYTFPGKDYNPPAGEYGTGPVSVNDHCIRVTSDYQMWYDVTNRITGEEVRARVSTAPSDPQFDGRIKVITLVVAYDDGDGDTVRYWVMDGQDTDSYQSEEKLGEDYIIRTTFPTGELPQEDEWAGARLQVVHLASEDATYTLNEDEPTDLITSGRGSYSGYNAWDVTGIITPWEDATLSCDRTGSFYKIFLAALSVRYPEQETGTLTVTSAPAGAALVIDGEETEYTTNCTIPDMPVGSYAVSVEHEHYEEGEEQWIDVSADEDTTVHFDLRPLTGSLSVTSDPTGAAVFIDGRETGLTTDTFLDDVIIGEHTISLRLAGYRDGVQTVSVTEGDTSEVTFVLIPETDSGDADDDSGNTGYTGKELTPRIVTTFRGDIVTMPFGTYTGLTEPGTTSRFTWNAPIPKGTDPLLARLYLYTTWGHNTEGKTGTEVPLGTRLDSGGIIPDKTYTDRKGEGSFDYVLSTICYNVTDAIREKGQGEYELSVTNEGISGEVCALYGGLLVVLCENKTAPEKTVWLSEGCDAIIADEAAGITPDEATTMIPFPGNISMAGIKSADLIVISTAATGKGDDAHRVVFNDWEYENVLTGGSSGISTWTESVASFLRETGNAAQVQSALMGAAGDYLENRNALLVITHTGEAGNLSVVTQPDSATNPAASGVTGTGKETFTLSSSGDRLHAAELKTKDGQCTLYVREGTRLLDPGGAMVSTVAIQQRSTLPGGNREWTYTISPEGATADIPLILEISGGVCKPGGAVALSRFETDSGTWTDAARMNRGVNAATTGISRLGTYTAVCSNEEAYAGAGKETALSSGKSHLYATLCSIEIPEMLIPFSTTADAPEEEYRIPDTASGILPEAPSPEYQAPEETYIDYRNGTYDVAVLSNPPQALVMLDGIYTGKTTPCILTGVRGGSHSLSVSREGFLESEKELTITDESEIRFDLPSETNGLRKLKFDGYLSNGYDDGIGGVYVTSHPDGAQIYLDGRNTGLTTPEVIGGLKEGRHTIKVRNDLMEYPCDIKSIWISPGVITDVSFDQAYIVTRTVELCSDAYRDAYFTVNGRCPRYSFPKKVDVSGTQPYITVFDNGSYISYEGQLWRDGEKVRIIPGEVTFGSVLVLSEPLGAEIMVDGYTTGLHTPYTITNLSAGLHTISISLPGHIPDEEVIRLVPGNHPIDTELQFLLEPYPFGSLNISSEPEGAKIYLNNKYSGKKTPAVFYYMDIGNVPVRLVSAEGTVTIENAVVSPYETAEYRATIASSE